MPNMTSRYVGGTVLFCPLEKGTNKEKSEFIRARGCIKIKFLNEIGATSFSSCSPLNNGESIESRVRTCTFEYFAVKLGIGKRGSILV